MRAVCSGHSVGGVESDALDLVRGSSIGLTAADVADKLGLRLSTARSRLDRLVDAGLLVKARASAGLPRRPPWRYRAMEPEPPAGTYRHLLAGLLEREGDDREEVAEAGAGWGRALAAAHPGPPDPVPTVVAVLDALGFAPRVVGDGVHLTACPYLELVRRNPDVMCGVHAGIARGVLDATGGGTASLDPFAVPGGCLVRLALR